MVRDYKYQDSIFILDLAPASVYLKCADLYLQCSRYEGLPYAILEAVQAELPILASDVGGIREILNNDAQLFTLNDSQEFLEKLDNILSHQEKTALTIQNNYKRLSLFSLEKMTQAYLDIYQ